MMSQYIETGKIIIYQLASSGYEAFFVGGFVRDYVLGIPYNDIDITTNATPEDVKRLFPNTKDTGLRYGTVTVFYPPFSYEVTTYRKDGLYEKHRKPLQIDFASSLEEDCRRRDFTINAMAMSAEGIISDFVGGKADLASHLIRAIGNPYERFEEDALRILRAFRFVSKLNFDIEETTYQAICEKKHLLKQLPSERILQEFQAIFGYNHLSKAIRYLCQSGVHEVFESLRNGFILASEQENLELDLLSFFALSFVLYDGVIPTTFRFSNKERQLIERLMMLVEVTSQDTFNEMIVYANGLSLCLQANKINRIIDSNNNQEERIIDLYQSMPIHKTCDLAYKGDHMIADGLSKNAKIIGDIIDDLIYQVIMKHLPNDFETLREYTWKHWLTKLDKKESQDE